MTEKRIILSLGFTFLLCFNFSWTQVSGPIVKQHNKVLLKNGNAHIGNGNVVEKSVIGWEAGKIILVKNALTYHIEKSEWDTIIDVKGQHVYPGFIAANSTLGLTEIDAVRATNDFDEVGPMNPNVRSLVAFNTDSKVMYTVRSNGILVTQSTPRGGLISGSSSIMALEGWNWEDAVYKADDGIHINWPNKYNQHGWWANPGGASKNENYSKSIQTLVQFFKEAEAYAQKKSVQPDLRLEAMRGIFKGNKRVYFHLDFAPEMNDAIDFARLFHLNYPVVVGGFDALYLIERLKENHFSIMLENPHHLPPFEGSLPTVLYELASQLQDSGILFCLQNSGSMEVMNARNLPFLAGTAMAYGLSEEEAVATISLNVAKILGVDHLLGSIEEGKDATLFVSSGDALDMRTNDVTWAFVKGNKINLDNHQKQLAEKYKNKYHIH